MATIAALAVALFFLAYPLYVIRPQRGQGAGELQAALWVLRWQHPVELICALAALAAVVIARRRFVAIVAALVVICAGLSRVNIFEILFHPAGAPAFQSLGETKLDPTEKLLTVSMKADARAYPIRAIAYHHIVNDVAGGVPIVVTY